MAPINVYFVAICAAALASALVGWFAPARKRLRLADCCLFVASALIGFSLCRDPLRALSLGTLFPGIYLAFSGWREPTQPPKAACYAAFFGAAWFLTNTTRRLDYSAVALVLGLAGPYFTLWLTRRTNRAVGIALVLAAAVFQLTRVPFLLAS
jgi:hypothetical protein